MRLRGAGAELPWISSGKGQFVVNGAYPNAVKNVLIGKIRPRLCARHGLVASAKEIKKKARIPASVPNPKFARLLSGHFCELRVQRDTRIISLLVSLWFGSSLRSKLRTQANFRTATLRSECHEQTRREPAQRQPRLGRGAGRRQRRRHDRRDG